MDGLRVPVVASVRLCLFLPHAVCVVSVTFVAHLSHPSPICGFNNRKNLSHLAHHLYLQ